MQEYRESVKQVNFMMKSKIVLLLVYLFLFLCKHVAAGEPIAKEGVLRSVNTGRIIAKLPIGIEARLDNASEYVLTVGNRNGITGLDGNKKTLWVFRQKLNACDFKNYHAAVEVNDIATFAPFCSNREVIFNMSKCHEIDNQSEFPFATTVSAGEKIKLTLCLYVASKTRKKTIIEEGAQMLLEFVLPANTGKNTENRVTTLSIDTELSGHGELTPEELNAMARQCEDSLLQVKVMELDIFISKQNQELNTFCTLINNTIQGDKNAVDSLAKLANDLNEKVKIKKEGNIIIISNNDALSEKYALFNTQYNELIQKIEELKKEPEKINWAMYIGIALGVLMLGGMLFMQIWNPIKIKRQQHRLARQADEAARQNEWNNIDINNLDQI